MPKPTPDANEQAKILDANVKKNYKIIYLKRNFRLKLRDAYAWGLDKADIDLLIETWKNVAHGMGASGRVRWAQIEREIPLWQETFKRLNGINWIDNKAITDMNNKQMPFIISDLLPKKKREEILNPLSGIDRVDLA